MASNVVGPSKLVNEFGCSTIDDALIARIEKATGCKAHPFLRRGMFFAHRELAGPGAAVSPFQLHCLPSPPDAIRLM
jgi:hypothetical protein